MRASLSPKGILSCSCRWAILCSRYCLVKHLYKSVLDEMDSLSKSDKSTFIGETGLITFSLSLSFESGDFCFGVFLLSLAAGGGGGGVSSSSTTEGLVTVAIVASRIFLSFAKSIFFTCFMSSFDLRSKWSACSK